jgi:NitT/TauT family transport system substrate-binding protein
MKRKPMVLATVFLLMIAITSISGLNGFFGENPATAKAAAKNAVKTIKVYYADGIPALTIAKLANEKQVIDKDYDVNYETMITPDALLAKVMSSDADIAIVPSNVAALAYNKNLPYRLAANSGWGSLYLVSTLNLKKMFYLKGKQVYNIGQGLTPDIVFNYILKKNKIIPGKDVLVTYLNGATELAPAFISGKSNIAVMPEPMLSTVLMKKSNAKVYFDLNKEWSKLTGSKNGYPQSCLIIKKDLIDNNRKFVDAFLAKYKESIEWANKNPSKLGTYAEELKLSMNKAVVEKTIERANLKYVGMKDCKKDYQNYYKVLFNFAPKSIGGKLPDEGLYFEK